MWQQWNYVLLALTHRYMGEKYSAWVRFGGSGACSSGNTGLTYMCYLKEKWGCNFVLKQYPYRTITFEVWITWPFRKINSYCTRINTVQWLCSWSCLCSKDTNGPICSSRTLNHRGWTFDNIFEKRYQSVHCLANHVTTNHNQPITLGLSAAYIRQQTLSPLVQAMVYRHWRLTMPWTNTDLLLIRHLGPLLLTCMNFNLSTDK